LSDQVRVGRSCRGAADACVGGQAADSEQRNQEQPESDARRNVARATEWMRYNHGKRLPFFMP
jgi:hypothetical protein